MNNVLPTEKVKDVLVTKTAIKLLRPENVIERVVAFQFKDAVAAFKEYSEVEVSGFGKFYVSESRTKKKILMYEGAIRKYNKELDSNPEEERKAFILSKIKDLEELIEYLKGKL